MNVNDVKNLLVSKFLASLSHSLSFVHDDFMDPNAKMSCENINPHSLTNFSNEYQVYKLLHIKDYIKLFYIFILHLNPSVFRKRDHFTWKRSTQFSQDRKGGKKNENNQNLPIPEKGELFFRPNNATSPLSKNE